MKDATIRENLKVVEDTIAFACKESGRGGQEVTLIAVSKTKPVEMLMVTYAELFQFCLVILGVVALVLDATKRNNRHPSQVLRLFP